MLQKGDIEILPFKNQSFNGIFSYSTIFSTNILSAFHEFFRVLRPCGLLYVNSNGLGLYIDTFLKNHNAAHDFSPRKRTIKTFKNTATYFLKGKRQTGEHIITTKNFIKQQLLSAGFRILACGGDGTIGKKTTNNLVSFFPERVWGFTGVFEVLAQKP